MEDKITAILDTATLPTKEGANEPKATIESIENLDVIKEAIVEIGKKKAEGDVAIQTLKMLEKIKTYNLTEGKERALAESFYSILEHTNAKENIEIGQKVLDTLLENVVDAFVKDDSVIQQINTKKNNGFVVEMYGKEGLAVKEKFLEEMDKEGYMPDEVMAWDNAKFEKRFRAYKNGETGRKTETPAGTQTKTTNINFKYSPDPSSFSAKIDLPKKI
jgi:hypothetical protein